LPSGCGRRPPAEFAARLASQDAAPAQAMGRRAGAHGASAPHPIASSSREGQSTAATGVIVSS
jgi:hypothetical protein